MGWFSKKPKIEPHIVYTGRPWDVSLVTDATDQSQVQRLVHASVTDFRATKALSTVGVLRINRAGQVAVVAHGGSIGALPASWQEGGRVLLARAADIGCELRVSARFEWDRKAGPFEVLVMLGEAADAGSVRIEPVSVIDALTR